MTALDGHIEQDVLNVALDELYESQTVAVRREAERTAKQVRQLAEQYLIERQGCLTPAGRERTLAAYAATMLCEAMRYGWDFEKISTAASSETAVLVSQVTPDFRIPFPLRDRQFGNQLAHADDLAKLLYLARLQRRLPSLYKFQYDIVKNYVVSSVEHVRYFDIDRRAKTGIAYAQMVRSKLYALEDLVQTLAGWRSHWLQQGVAPKEIGKKNGRVTKRKKR